MVPTTLRETNVTCTKHELVRSRETWEKSKGTSEMESRGLTRNIDLDDQTFIKG